MPMHRKTPYSAEPVTLTETRKKTSAADYKRRKELAALRKKQKRLGTGA